MIRLTDSSILNPEVAVPPVRPVDPPRQPLHRLRAVRRTENLSLQQVARRMRVDVKTVIRQEDEHADLRLSDLARWQKALGVPLIELLSEPDQGLAESTLIQGRLVRLMKTALAIQEERSRTRISRLVQNLIDQLVEIKPELRSVTAWPRERAHVSLRNSAVRRGNTSFRRAAEVPTIWATNWLR